MQGNDLSSQPSFGVSAQNIYSLRQTWSQQRWWFQSLMLASFSVFRSPMKNQSISRDIFILQIYLHSVLKQTGLIVLNRVAALPSSYFLSIMKVPLLSCAMFYSAQIIYWVWQESIWSSLRCCDSSRERFCNDVNRYAANIFTVLLVKTERAVFTKDGISIVESLLAFSHGRNTSLMTTWGNILKTGKRFLFGEHLSFPEITFSNKTFVTKGTNIFISFYKKKVITLACISSLATTMKWIGIFR